METKLNGERQKGFELLKCGDFEEVEGRKHDGEYSRRRGICNAEECTDVEDVGGWQ